VSRALNDLDPVFKQRAMELLARCVEAGIMVMVVDTARTEEEQAENLRRGVSWTRFSRHLIGRAIDICPFEMWQLHGPDKLKWDATDPVWEQLGKIGKKLGLIWGGDWQQRDLGHFEWRG
jgi:peptidoglycan L-alanyl-D-glutamate endopeptidase CwlK